MELILRYLISAVVLLLHLARDALILLLVPPIVTGERSISTDILSLLLNMHDYNHQNGTHRELFGLWE